MFQGVGDVSMYIGETIERGLLWIEQIQCTYKPLQTKSAQTPPNAE